MSQLFRSSQSLYHVTNCCRMFVSSWLEKPKQIQHQSTEALNCDLFCQSCENKGCIKCPATTEGRSDPSAQEGECCLQRVCLHGDHRMDCCSLFVVVVVLVFDAESQCGRSRDLVFRGGSSWEVIDCVPFIPDRGFIPTSRDALQPSDSFFLFNPGRQLKNRNGELSSSQAFWSNPPPLSQWRYLKPIRSIVFDLWCISVDLCSSTETLWIQ